MFGVPLPPNRITWTPKHVIFLVLTFIEGFMEARLMNIEQCASGRWNGRVLKYVATLQRRHLKNILFKGICFQSTWTRKKISYFRFSLSPGLASVRLTHLFQKQMRHPALQHQLGLTNGTFKASGNCNKIKVSASMNQVLTVLVWPKTIHLKS